MWISGTGRSFGAIRCLIPGSAICTDNERGLRPVLEINIWTEKTLCFSIGGKTSVFNHSYHLMKIPSQQIHFFQVLLGRFQITGHGLQQCFQ
jgi:hypothetical protein